MAEVATGVGDPPWHVRSSVWFCAIILNGSSTAAALACGGGGGEALDYRRGAAKPFADGVAGEAVAGGRDGV
jgi:hypothetical protein